MLDDFEVDEIMGCEYSTGPKKVLCIMKYTGCPEQSQWTSEPFKYLPRTLVCEFYKRHPEAAMDEKLKKKVRR